MITLDNLDENPFDLDENPFDLDENPFDLDENPFDFDENPFDLVQKSLSRPFVILAAEGFLFNFEKHF